MQPGQLVLLISFVQCLCLAYPATNNHTLDSGQDDAELPKQNVTKEILKASETADPAKVEIVKQIRRLNEDGSYTIGYEADDGTFKIESRDVLGNVKGTFGYIDKDGEIKRVTYSSSSDSTPHTMPTTTTMPSTTTTLSPMLVRVNSSVSSTTRRPLPTVVYPRSSHSTRGTVIQPIPRRRVISATTRSATTTNSNVTTTEVQKALGDGTTGTLNMYRNKNGESGQSIRTQILKPVSESVKEDIESKHVSDTAKTATTVKPVFEDTNEQKIENTVNKANTIRRQSSDTSPNPHMLHLQQSIGDDSTDVYGSHLSHGTVRPLFTTTTLRPRLIPFPSIIAAQQKLQHQFQNAPVEPEHETTIEASTGRVFDTENIGTSNQIPIVHIPIQERDDRFFHRQVYRQPVAAVQFRSHEYMRDNPGAPIPIGNQRPFTNLGYQQQQRTFEPQFVKEVSQAETKMESQVPPTVEPYGIRPVTKIIPIPVDERGIPIQGYQTRFASPYVASTQSPAPVLFRSRVVEAQEDDMNSIATPVSTRDLRRLLHILLIRQARLQALMDQIVAPGSSYQPLSLFRQADPHYGGYDSRLIGAVGYQNVAPRNYHRENDRYDYRGYDQQYRSQQQELYTNQISNYEQPQYESQRYVPRRRTPRPPAYDAAGASTTQVEESPDYLPPEIREALLLKMLVLAISPDYMPTPAPSTELTTSAPPRKQVRNVQILSEEGSLEDMKSKMQRH